jgi:ATP-dependent DNA helicase RecG
MAMEKNGSPEPLFETDADYSFFIITLPIHPAFLSVDGVSDGVDGVNDGVNDEISDGVDGVSDGVSDGVNDGVNENIKIAKSQSEKIHNLVRYGVNEGANDIINILLNVSGLNASEIALRINKSIPTVERYLRLLRKKGIVEFKGVPKTGGYHLTEKAKAKLK